MIYSMDVDDSKPIRAAHRAAHLEYLEKHQHLLIASGGLQDHAGERYVGACILLDVETLEEAQAFVDGDPFTEAGLLKQVVITRWKGFFLDGNRLSV